MPGTPDARSLMSHDHRPLHLDRGDSVLPNESASHHGDSPPQSALGGAAHASPEDVPFPFKFKSPSGRVHRIQVIASAGIEELVSSVAGKLGAEVDSIGGTPIFEDGNISRSGFALSYLDNDGDTVSITTNHDLIEAITLSRLAHREKVDLFVHDPDKAPLPATTTPQPSTTKPPTPPESVLRERRKFFDEEDEETHPRPRSQPSAVSKQEELIAGVPNDLLLPGAIVTLAVVIIAVFAIGRASSR